MTFNQGQSVRVIQPNSGFHNQTGVITNVFNILGSNTSGINITVRLDDSGHDIYINRFSRIAIAPVEQPTLQ
jgi:hypothetical protein